MDLNETEKKEEEEREDYFNISTEFNSMKNVKKEREKKEWMKNMNRRIER